ncbi:MAG: serS [Actinomycetia bacterium]|nr:serS [Actinomycetes bacterium]
MLDVRTLRTELDAVKAGLARRRIDTSDLDRAADLDTRQRAALSESERLRAEVKRLSGEVGRARKEGDAATAERLTGESRALGQQQGTLEAEASALATELRDVLLGIPNLPADDAPDGDGPDDNVVLKTVGGDRTWAEHQRVPHWEIGGQLGILDPERATRMSGSMFNMYRGAGARLLRALVQLSLDRAADLWEEVRPPSVVRTETMVSTGHLPKFADDAYHVERDDLWLIPTAEVPLTSMHAGEVLDEAELPRRYAAYSPCFRREAGSAGRDTRGLLRSHEFDKVELMAFTTAADAGAVHADIVARAEGILADLGLAYRVLDLCAGDLGFGGRRTFDLEAYAPGCDQWLEVSSVSWYGDFQARRSGSRYRPAEGKGTEFLHTLNGSVLGWPRTWAAVVETHRRPDGRIDVPEVLRPYLGGAETLP